MPIRFTCPVCKADLFAPDGMQGAKSSCRQCGQRIEVPGGTNNKTVLGQLIPLKGQATKLTDAISAGPDYDPNRFFAVQYGPMAATPLSTPQVQELLNRDWDSMSGEQFELFLGEIFQCLGYPSEKTVPPDQGVDLIVTVGTKRIAVQTKRWGKNVGNNAIQEVHLGVKYWHCDLAIAITNKKFTRSAQDAARAAKCGLVDGDKLPDLIQGLFIPPAVVVLGAGPAQKPSSPPPRQPTATPQAAVRVATPPGPVAPLPTHCFKCGRKLNNILPCDVCLEIFCSQDCLDGHEKKAGHSQRIQAPPAPPALVFPQSIPEPVSTFDFAQVTSDEFQPSPQIRPRSSGPGLLSSIALLLGIVVCAMATRTKRPQNGCGACGYSWFPKGMDVSRRCPNCGSTSVSAYPGALAIGWLMLVLIGLGMAAIPIILFQKGVRATRSDSIAQTSSTNPSVRPLPQSATATQTPRENPPPRVVPIAQIVAEQREALATGNPQARIKAAERLAELGPQAAEGVPALVDSLASEDPKVKAAVIDALGKIGPAAQPARPALLPLLTIPPVEIRRAAAQALLKIGLDPAATAQWVKAFQDEDDEVAATAAQALSSAGALPKEETPMLVDLLKVGKPVQRRHAATFLGAMKAEGKPVISGLADALRDAEKAVRLEAAEALGKIGPRASPAALALGNALKDKEAEVRKSSLSALSKIGPDASNAAPSLITALGDSELHDSALNTLVKIGKGAVRDLGRALTDSRNTKVRLELIDILGQIGPDAREAVPALTKILGSEDYPSVQRAAREALAKIQK